MGLVSEIGSDDRDGSPMHTRAIYLLVTIYSMSMLRVLTEMIRRETSLEEWKMSRQNSKET